MSDPVITPPAILTKKLSFKTLSSDDHELYACATHVESWAEIHQPQLSQPSSNSVFHRNFATIPEF